MLGSSSTLSIIPHVQTSVQYDALKDFTSIALVASYPYYLAVPADSQFKTFDDLIAYGRDKSHQLSYASAGTGAVNHLAGEWLKEETGINALHVPYKGDSAAMPDLISGRVDYALLAGIVALPQVEAGKLRVLASASSCPIRARQLLKSSEIGRASCRDRVCTSVSISVVDVTLKKKQNK